MGLQFIPDASKGVATLTLADVPDEVRNDIEEAYTMLKTNPGRLRATFNSLDELNLYIAQVKAYCDLRPTGAIRFRKSPTRDLPKTTMDFRITDLKTENETVTDEIRDAVAAVNTTAKTSTAKK